MDIRFDDYNAYPDSDIVSVTDRGIALSTGQFIGFAECAANFRSIHGGSGTCVGERNAQEGTIVFYTAPLTTHICFVPGSRLREFLRRDSAIDRFHRLCRQMADGGWTTCDGS